MGSIMLLVGLIGAPAAQRAAEEDASAATLNNAVFADALAVSVYDTVGPDLTGVWLLHGVAGFGVLAVLLGLTAFAFRR
ncbi:hypothetical protein [Microbacterium sp. LMI1x-1-1.1]|uniref:hypothetical protein n=1 Tax=Microbacterium sp. LMI1x-1-1.1 TaxID=3135246 RepID=UPI00343AD05A